MHDARVDAIAGAALRRDVAPLPGARARSVRGGPRGAPALHAPRRAARLGQDAARLRDPAPARGAGARARAELGDPGAVGARRRGVRRAAGARRRRAPARRSRASPTRRSRGSTIRARRCAARPRRAGRPSAPPPRARTPGRSPPRRRRGRARRRSAGRASWRASPPSLKRDDRARGAAQGDGVRLADLLAPGRARAGRGAAGRRRADDRARRVPPPRVAVGLRRAGGARELGGDVHVVGLTATPPDELTTAGGRALRRAARARSTSRSRPRRSCATATSRPYQELAWLTEPLAGEQQWLDEHETRFRELVTGLLDVARTRARSTSGSG